MKNNLKKLAITMTIVSLLSGCAAAVIGGAAAGGLSIADRRSTGAQADDQVMEVSIKSKSLDGLKKIATDKTFSPSVSVVSYNRNILLIGHVKDQEQKQFVERVARSHPAANKIYNYIALVGDRNFGNVANDSWVTSKIRAMLLAPKGYNPNQVKVVTYAGVTYAFGILTPEEQVAATQQISTTQGVQKVVTLYETFTHKKTH